MDTQEASQAYRSRPLRVYRVARGYSQESLGRVAGVSRRQVSRLEAGESTPTRKTANAIAFVLAVEPEALFPPGSDDQEAPD